MRIRAACRILTATDDPLKAVAGSLGFCDEYYFSRAFKAEMKTSPGRYRASRRSVQTPRGRP